MRVLWETLYTYVRRKRSTYKGKDWVKLVMKMVKTCALVLFIPLALNRRLRFQQLAVFDAHTLIVRHKTKIIEHILAVWHTRIQLHLCDTFVFDSVLTM